MTPQKMQDFGQGVRRDHGACRTQLCTCFCCAASPVIHFTILNLFRHISLFVYFNILHCSQCADILCVNVCHFAIFLITLKTKELVINKGSSSAYEPVKKNMFFWRHLRNKKEKKTKVLQGKNSMCLHFPFFSFGIIYVLLYSCFCKIPAAFLAFKSPSLIFCSFRLTKSLPLHFISSC